MTVLARCTCNVIVARDIDVDLLTLACVGGAADAAVTAESSDVLLSLTRQAVIVDLSEHLHITITVHCMNPAT